jgi:hypothetical protein
LTLWTQGCGDSSGSFVATQGENPAVETNALPAVLGRLSIGRPVAQASALFTVDGQTLATTVTTDEQGHFGTDANLPPAFTVLVRPAGSVLQGSNLSFASRVEGFTNQSPEIIVNVPTTLMTRFHDRHPELSLAQARARVYSFLLIPQEVPLEAIDDSLRAPFLHSLFFRLAEQNGGVEAYLEKLLDEMEGPTTHPINFETTGPPGAGGAAQKKPTFLGGCAEGLAEDFVKAEVLTGLGWAFRAMGLNFPFPSNFDLEKKLDQLSDEVEALGNELTRFENEVPYQMAINKLGDEVVAPSDASTQALTAAVESHSIPLKPNLAYLPLGTSYGYLSELEAAFAQNDAQGMLDLLVSYLEGTYSPDGVAARLERLLVQVLFGPWGIDNDLTSYNGYGAFSNATLSQQAVMLQYYLGYLEQTTLLYTEQTHNAADATTLVSNIRAAKPYLASLARAKKRILAQVPQSLGSDALFVDRQAGAIWYMGNLGSRGTAQSWSDAKTYASKFAGVGPLSSGWRLPSDIELARLHQRIAAANNALASPTGKPSGVMTRWGWDISYIGGNHRVWTSSSNVWFSLDDADTKNDLGGRNDVILVHDYSLSSTDDSFLPLLSLGSAQNMQIDGATGADLQGPGNPSVQLRCEALINGTYGGTYTVGGKSVKSPSGSGFGVSFYDLTEQVEWSSSNELMATVSNFEATYDAQGNELTPASHGLVVWQPQFAGTSLEPVTIVATYQGASASVTLQPPTSVTPVLSSIQVFPYNVDFGALVAPVQQSFAAVMFFKDPVTGDAQVQSFNEATAPPVTWSLTDANGVPLSSAQNSGFITSDPDLLLLNTTLTTTYMLVQATSGAVTAAAPIKAGILPAP